MTIDGVDTRTSNPAKLAQRVGIVFQDPESQFLTMSVRDEIAFGPENLALPRDEISRRIKKASEAVGVDDLLDRAPYELSGGQKQRVAIAAALAMEPHVLVLDEPTSQLDPMGKMEIFSVLEDLRKNMSMTIILVEHVTEEIVKYADRMMLLCDGKIELLKTVQEFFDDVDFLVSKGVPIPQVTELGNLLRRDGMPLDKMPLTLERAVDVCSRLVGGQQ